MKRERRGNALSWGLGKKKCNVGHDEVLSNNEEKISNNKINHATFYKRKS